MNRDTWEEEKELICHQGNGLFCQDLMKNGN